jgi:hypothetical protein
MGDKMNSTKLWFGILILFIVGILISSPLVLRYVLEKKDIELNIVGRTILDSEISKYGFTTYGNPQHNSCYITIPDKTIILRMDDVRAFSTITEPVIEEILKENMTVTLGVVPSSIDKDPVIRKFLLETKNNPLVEIAQHGISHNESDIKIDEELLVQGKNKIEKYTLVSPVTYSTPFNSLDSSSEKTLAKYFRIITGEWGVLKEGEIAQLGHTVSNYAYSQEGETSMDELVERCKISLQRTNYCVILLHPQEFAEDINNPEKLDDKKMEELRIFLQDLKSLNANFLNFKDVVTCYEENNTFENEDNLSNEESEEIDYSKEVEEQNISEKEFVHEWEMTEEKNELVSESTSYFNGTNIRKNVVGTKDFIVEKSVIFYEKSRGEILKGYNFLREKLRNVGDEGR